MSCTTNATNSNKVSKDDAMVVAASVDCVDLFDKFNECFTSFDVPSFDKVMGVNDYVALVVTLTLERFDM